MVYGLQSIVNSGFYTEILGLLTFPFPTPLDIIFQNMTWSSALFDRQGLARGCLTVTKPLAGNPKPLTMEPIGGPVIGRRGSVWQRCLLPSGPHAVSPALPACLP